jgi:hypothetical protein
MFHRSEPANRRVRVFGGSATHAHVAAGPHVGNCSAALAPDLAFYFALFTVIRPVFPALPPDGEQYDRSGDGKWPDKVGYRRHVWVKRPTSSGHSATSPK